MEQKPIEVVGKVFVVVGGERRCLVCEGIFTPTQAAERAKTICRPRYSHISRKAMPTC